MEIVLSAEPRIIALFSELNGVYEFISLELVLADGVVVGISDTGFDYLPGFLSDSRSVVDLVLSDRIFELRALLRSNKLQSSLVLARAFEQFYQAV